MLIPVISRLDDIYCMCCLGTKMDTLKKDRITALGKVVEIAD